MRLKKEVRENLVKFLRGQKDVKVAYLFGSAAKGELGPLSDIDIAVYLDEKLSKAERNKKELFLIYEISGILNTDKFDLVVMNDSPLLLNFNIIRDGLLLKKENESEKVKLETSIISLYLDRDYHEKILIENDFERIGKRGIL
jgi:predicted nucleotidyltransferase